MCCVNVFTAFPVYAEQNWQSCMRTARVCHVLVASKLLILHVVICGTEASGAVFADRYSTIKQCT